MPKLKNLELLMPSSMKARAYTRIFSCLLTVLAQRMNLLTVVANPSL